MTPQETELITTLLARLKTAGGQLKDPEADALIRQAMAEQPDAVALGVLDEAIPEQGADLVEDPGHDGVQLVRSVIERESVALEAAAQAAEDG